MSEILKRVRENLLFGWTAQQWAIAAARYEIDDFRNMGEVEALRSRWDREQTVEPGEIRLAGVEQTTNMMAAYKAFQLAGRIE